MRKMAAGSRRANVPQWLTSLVLAVLCLRALVPVGRMGTLDDVIDAILFLLSERSSYITGEVLDINGGMWCD